MTFFSCKASPPLNERLRGRNERNELILFWQRLGQVKQLTFLARARQTDEINIKTGKAEVTVVANSSSTFIFQEKGYWFSDQRPDIAFSNSFRWTLDITNNSIALDHLRYGSTRPVFLLHLIPTKPSFLESVEAHLCGKDTYLGNIVWSQDEIRFNWKITGPRKNDELVISYLN